MVPSYWPTFDIGRVSFFLSFGEDFDYFSKPEMKGINRGKLEKELDSLKSRAGAAGFAEKAPQEVVDKLTVRISELERILFQEE